MPQIESLLAARLFLAPQIVGDQIYFLSNLGGQLSLYRMKAGGSVPEMLLPPGIALQNPELIGGYVFYVFPKIGKILVMIDHDGDENYEPHILPIDGGMPVPAFGGQLTGGYRSHTYPCDPEANVAYFVCESRAEPKTLTFQGDLANDRLTEIASSGWGMYTVGANADNTRVTMVEGYTVGDTVLYEWTAAAGKAEVRIGTPLEARTADTPARLDSFGAAWYTPGDRGILLTTTRFHDTTGLAYLPLNGTDDLRDVSIAGVVHSGVGELTSLEWLAGDRYSVGYNIDGVSWLYEGRFDEASGTMRLEHVICGQPPLAAGVLEASYYDKIGDRFALAHSTATSPTQLYTVEGQNRDRVVAHTAERVLGIPQEHLSPGEDASFVSHDGLRVSARLYLPAPALGFTGPRPLVYYVHGGPQGQERPNFAWFSMPLIQFLTLNGFAVFVPNVRGSTGYGLAYTKHVDRDWGGQDRLDHVHAMGLLAQDPRVDVKRAAVIGRSYGGYMTLTLAGRHPDLWAAAVDMFGPSDLTKFMERVPETWKPYFKIAVGDPDKDHDFLAERSPVTYLDNIRCPMLVIQGANDPRVIELESREVAERIQANGRPVEMIVFGDEGHDVLKFANRVRCYNAITEFFREHLHPEQTEATRPAEAVAV
jgi:dipeptidyl aminopeptidase/acylaminoacyl peptidase